MTEHQWAVIPRHPNPKCSGPEQSAWFTIVGNDLPVPEVEYRFRRNRNWRFDFAWPGASVALEIEGGHWIGGHSGKRFERDLEKYNAATAAGWRVIRVTPRQIAHSMLDTLATVGIVSTPQPNEFPK